VNLLISLGVGLLTLGTPGDARVHAGVHYGPGARERMDVYAPRRTEPHTPVVVFFYGGSWQSGDRSLYQFVGRSLASRGIVAVIPDYRLYPEVRYPEFLRDGASAVAYARLHARDWGGDPDRLFLAGHSAGAYNAMMLATDKRWLGEVGLVPNHDVAGVIGLAGPYDFLPLRDPILKTIFGPPDTLPATQPIHHLDGATPPMRLLAGDGDTVVDPGNSTRMAAAVNGQGGAAQVKIYAGLGHISLLTAISGPFRRRAPVLDDMVSFVRGGAPSISAAVRPTRSPIADTIGATP